MSNWKEDYKRQVKYDAANTIKMTFKFNKNTDADVIEALNASGSKRRLVIESIRAYVANKGENKMKPINEELKEILKANNKHAILDTENDILKELDRLDTSREIDYKAPQPDADGKAECTGTSRLTIGKNTITVYHNIYLYGWDEEEKEYTESSSEIIGWE